MARKISRNPAPRSKTKVKAPVAQATARTTYERYPTPYALSRTVGGQERGYVMVGPDWVYQVIPTSKGLILERLDNDTAGTTRQRVTKTREYTVNPRTLEVS